MLVLGETSNYLGRLGETTKRMQRLCGGRGQGKGLSQEINNIIVFRSPRGDNKENAAPLWRQTPRRRIVLGEITSQFFGRLGQTINENAPPHQRQKSILVLRKRTLDHHQLKAAGGGGMLRWESNCVCPLLKKTVYATVELQFMPQSTQISNLCFPAYIPS